MSNSIPRPTWDDTWLSVARTVARRSLCVRDQVGAVIVNADNRIIATGYNGSPQGFNHWNKKCIEWCDRAQVTALTSFVVEDAKKTPVGVSYDPDYHDCPSLHAEANALSVCDRTVRERGTIYVTSAVCFGCAKLIANSGLLRVVVDGGTQERAPHRNAGKSYEFLKSCGLQVEFR